MNLTQCAYSSSDCKFYSKPKKFTWLFRIDKLRDMRNWLYFFISHICMNIWYALYRWGGKNHMPHRLLTYQRKKKKKKIGLDLDQRNFALFQQSVLFHLDVTYYYWYRKRVGSSCTYLVRKRSNLSW